MNTAAVLSFLIAYIVDLSISNLVYHEKSYILFTSNREAPNEYFGYSVLLKNDGLYVGAPKARLNQTGSVYVCPLHNLNTKHVICKPLGTTRELDRRFPFYSLANLLKVDSWFGSSIASLSENILLVTAPRLQTRYIYPNSHLKMHGACYVLAPKTIKILEPLHVDGLFDNQSFTLDGSRKSFGKINQSVPYYSLGHAGFSLAVTKNSSVLLGAPGLMQFTGTVISYTFDINETESKLQPIANTYYTTELDKGDYFGYSVDSGIFELNGSLLHIGGAPRSAMGRGKVLVFSPPTDNEKPLDIKAKLIGPHFGSYFGASLCCTDINNDGLDDLLVGAPTYMNIYDSSTYDQGAVFVYVTEKGLSGFVLIEAGYLIGSNSNGARFGTTIADLGDINDDGFRDIAIGAPWELDGVGAVYIYLGTVTGLSKKEVQKIQPPGTRGFGWSISKGFDIDGNNCNDLAVGAYSSGATYLFRCIPPMSVRALIRVPEVMSLSPNVTTFTAMFCVCALPNKFRPDMKLKLIGKIIAHPKDIATATGDSQYVINVSTGNEICDEKTIRVFNRTLELGNVIKLIFELEEEKLMKDNSTMFLLNAARLSHDSVLKTEQSVYIMPNCGGKICRSSLKMRLETLDNPYVPGSNKRLGVKFTASNVRKTANSVLIKIRLPMNPRRIPLDCSYKDLTLTCNVPPVGGNDTFVWDIELEYNLQVVQNIRLTVAAEVINKFHNTTGQFIKVLIDVTPQASFSISGKSMPNTALTISRNGLAAGANVSFKHLFEITNYGPSDWPALIGHIRIPDKAHPTSTITGCISVQRGFVCMWSIPAKVSYPVAVPLQMDLGQEGNYLKRKTSYNATTSIVILLKQNKFELKYMGYELTTSLSLEPSRVIWCIVIPSIFLGFLLLAIIVRVLFKFGFFVRKYNILLAEHEIRLIKQSLQPPEQTT